MTIETLREEIDTVDDEIVVLLEKRKLIAGNIKELKEKGNIPIEDLKREEEIVAKLSENCLLSREEIEKIYSIIFSLSKK